MKDLFELVREDHEALSDILDKLRTSLDKEGHAREQLLASLAELLDAHARAEEELLYPLLTDGKVEHEDQSYKGIDEHREAARLAGDLTRTADDASFLWCLDSLEAIVRHHFDDEDTRVFPQIRATIPQRELEHQAVRWRKHRRADDIELPLPDHVPAQTQVRGAELREPGK